MLNWSPFLAANSYRLSVPTIYVQIQFHFTNSFSRIIFMDSLCHQFSFINSMSRIRFHKLICEFGNIWKSSYEFVWLRFGSFLRNQCYVANGLYCIFTSLSSIKCQLSRDVLFSKKLEDLQVKNLFWLLFVQLKLKPFFIFCCCNWDSYINSW